MRKTTIALLGVLIGQLLMIPSLYKIYITPSIVSEFVDVQDGWWSQTDPVNIVIKDVPSVFFKGKKDLHIHIRPRRDIISEYKKIKGEDEPALLGFYDPKPKNKEIHEIYTVNSMGILIHELRHPFEGYFHREALNDVSNK